MKNSKPFKLSSNEKYLFATDLDGTFLTDFNSGMHIDNFLAAKLIIEKGHHLILTTGRSWWWTKTLYKQLGLIDPTIHFAGGQIHHEDKEHFIAIRICWQRTVIIELLKKFTTFDKFQQVIISGREYAAEISEIIDIDKIFFNIYELIFVVKDNDSENISIIKNQLETIFNGDEFIIRYWKKSLNHLDFFTISPTKTDKSIALEYLAKFYKIPSKNIIYFGDDENDLNALQYAGHSYAVANASKNAKASAKEVLTKTNNEGTVAKKIIELLTDEN